MRILIKIIKRTLVFFGITYLCALVALYFYQEKLFFHPTKIDSSEDLDLDYKYSEEVYIKVDQNIKIHGIITKNPNFKNIRVLFHGNGGTAKSWLDLIPLIDIKTNYLIVDYRGYGKSNGNIESEEQLLTDMQKVYDFLKTQYLENQITIEGYSMGTGIATYLASKNNPKNLILNAPYFSLLELSQEKVPIVPSFIIKYQLKTNENIKCVKCPITIFHGKKDQLISINHSERLQKLNNNIKLFKIDDVAHMGIFDTQEYKKCF